MKTLALWDNPSELNNDPSIVFQYFPAQKKKTKATVLVLPGGGYQNRLYETHEGAGYAAFFNSIGMDAFVLQYRILPCHFPLPLIDARRAMRYIRFHAEEFDICPDKIAIIGSSAGGHLAALTSTYLDEIEGEVEDEIDRLPFLPNATILCYPVIEMADMTVAHVGSAVNLLGFNRLHSAAAFTPSRIVSEKTPPAFVWHTAEDDLVDVTNSLRYGEGLHKKNIPFELHIFPHGPHGMGLAKDTHVGQWTGLLINWLKNIGFFGE
ncbi:MAG: alpha/beta hydrolase [Clostridia bacterium]|nr:alpha/beta hydrolase [Clostridia bacterium]